MKQQISFQILMVNALATVRVNVPILAQLAVLYGALNMLFGRLWRDDLAALLTLPNMPIGATDLPAFAPGLVFGAVVSILLAALLLVIWARACLGNGVPVLAGGPAALCRRWYGTIIDFLLASLVLGIVVIIAGVIGQFISILLGGADIVFASALIVLMVLVPAILVLTAFLIAVTARAHDTTPRFIAIVRSLQPAWLPISGFVLFSFFCSGLIASLGASLVGGLGNPPDLNQPSAILSLFIEAVTNFLWLGFLLAGFGSIWRAAAKPRVL